MEAWLWGWREPVGPRCNWRLICYLRSIVWYKLRCSLTKSFVCRLRSSTWWLRCSLRCCSLLCFCRFTILCLQRGLYKLHTHEIYEEWKAIINGAPHWWRNPNPMVQQLHIEEYKQKPNFMRKHSLELNLFALSLFFHFFFFLTSIFLCRWLKMDVIGTKISVTFDLKIRVYMLGRTL